MSNRNWNSLSIFGVTLVGIVCLYIFYTYYGSNFDFRSGDEKVRDVDTGGGSGASPAQSTVHEAGMPSNKYDCEWNEGDPVIYRLNTKLGVNYEGDHWFHVAENFMTLHSILRAQGHTTTSNNIYFDFDKKGFAKQLNGMTKMMTSMAVVDMPETEDLLASSKKNRKFHFIHTDRSKLPSNKLHTGDHILLRQNHVTEHLITTLEDGDNVFERFLSHKDTVDKTKSAKGGDRALNANHSRTLLNDHHEQSPRRYMRSLTASSKTNVCVKYMGEYGGKWPTPQRGNWFPNKGDVETFRKKISVLCPCAHVLASLQGGGGHTTTNTHDHGRRMQDHGYTNMTHVVSSALPSRKKSMLIYQRDLSRSIANEDYVVDVLPKIFTPEQWSHSILRHIRDRSPCELAHDLREVDVLITPHGFQSMLVLFLPENSIIFEVFPYKYYKRGYGPLSGEIGVHHYGVMSPPLSWDRKWTLPLITTQTCMESKECRNYARTDNVHMNKHGVYKLREAVTKHFPQYVKRVLHYTARFMTYDDYERHSKLFTYSTIE